MSPLFPPSSSSARPRREATRAATCRPTAIEPVNETRGTRASSESQPPVSAPPGTSGTGQPVYCGYHTQTTSIDGYGNPYRIEYAFIPYLNMNWPGLGTGGCGAHFVNATSDAFGNGIHRRHFERYLHFARGSKRVDEDRHRGAFGFLK